MKSLNKNQAILDILTWLTGEKTILANSLIAGEITAMEYARRMENAIARCVTEIKDKL